MRENRTVKIALSGEMQTYLHILLLTLTGALPDCETGHCHILQTIGPEITQVYAFGLR